MKTSTPNLSLGFEGDDSMSTRDRIVRVATLHFAKHGIAGSAMRGIAAEVGIAAPSIYAHFSSKEELFGEVYSLSVAEQKVYFDELIEESHTLSPTESLQRLLWGVRAFYRERPELVDLHLRAVAGSGPLEDPALGGAFRGWDQELLATIRSTYRAGKAKGAFAEVDPDAFGAMFLCLMDGLFLQLRYHEPDVYEIRLNQTWRCVEVILGIEVGR